MPESSSIAQYAPFIGLAGTALGGAIGFFSAIYHAKKAVRKVAGSKLRAAFAPELALVRTTPQETWKSMERITGDRNANLDAILVAAFERHAAAIEEYRFFVPAKSHAGYDAAWQAYYDEAGRKGFSRYMYGVAGHELFFQNVEAIFRFTE